MNPDVLSPEANKEIRQFVISTTRNMGIKRDASKGSFIDTGVDHDEGLLRRGAAEPEGMEGPTA